jgi:hypothetical protein
MKFREHKGGLEDSMATVVELKDRDELNWHIAKLLAPWDRIVLPTMIHAEAYGYDPRVDWVTWLITVDGYGVVGYTDGEPK